MLLRRTFIVGALSLPVGAVSLSAAARAAGLSAPRGKVLLVGDPRIPGTARFVRAWPAGETSAPHFEDEDLPSLYTRLKAIWRREGAGPIAGLTTARTFFCLSHAAADHGLRLIHRQVHGEAGEPSRDWPAEVVATMHLALLNGQGRTGKHTALSIPEFLPDGAHASVSWLMVPRGHVAA